MMLLASPKTSSSPSWSLVTSRSRMVLAALRYVIIVFFWGNILLKPKHLQIILASGSEKQSLSTLLKHLFVQYQEEYLLL